MHEKPFNLSGCALKLTAGSVLILALMGGAAYLAGKVPVVGENTIFLVIVLLAVFIIGTEVSVAILSPGDSTPFGILGAKRGNSSLETLKSKQLVATDEFHIRHTIYFEDDGSGGISYLCELADGQGLFLRGQYLYEYELFEPEDNGPPTPRSFPNSHIQTHRDKRNGRAIELTPLGTVSEPDIKVIKTLKNAGVSHLLDGQVIPAAEYQETRKRLEAEDKA